MPVRRPESWVRRTRRGLLCACACLLLGAVSHVAAGGRLPGAGALGLLFAALTAQGTLLIGGSRRRFDVMTLVLGGTQFSLHLAFHHLSTLDSGGYALPPGHTVPHMADHPTGPHVGMAPMNMASAGDGLGTGHAMTAAMTWAHAVATLGTALCVMYGERVLRRLAALVVPDICCDSRLSVPFTPPLRHVPRAAVRTGIGVLLARSRPRRGPPRAVAPA
ncbi:hypothetical protein XF35_19860 [Streptomyces platensis subsp. clarensis]|nr:hypothetical protein [Streptomyces platensis subsp. clarensis]